MQSLSEKLYKNSLTAFAKEFNYQNPLAAPRLKTVSVSVAVKSADSDTKFINYLSEQVAVIAGQKPAVTKAKKAISSFKLREGMAVGCKVTLRRKKMYQFLDKLVNIALPRIRDFRGLNSSGFNESNHYSFGIKDSNIFLEYKDTTTAKPFGMNITITSTAKTKEEALYLLRTLNFPIK